MTLLEFFRTGRRHADAGMYSPPYLPADSEREHECNKYYLLGFRQRRDELRDRFKWKDDN